MYCQGDLWDSMCGLFSVMHRQYREKLEYKHTLSHIFSLGCACCKYLNVQCCALRDWKVLILSLAMHVQQGLQYLVCHSVCLFVRPFACLLPPTTWPKSDTNGFSATLVKNGNFHKCITVQLYCEILGSG